MQVNYSMLPLQYDGRMKSLRALLIGGVLAFAAGAQAAPPSAVLLSLACDGCHGTLGASADSVMPSISGQPTDYFIATMKKFRSGERPSTVMGRLARGYSDGEIEAMASFYARFPPARRPEAIDAKLAERGAAIFQKQCKTCHLDRGPLWRQVHRGRDYDNQCRHCHGDYGNDARGAVPFIAGQGADYLTVQLREFTAGTRPMSKTKAQRLKGLSAEDQEAVAHYYASQAVE